MSKTAKTTIYLVIAMLAWGSVYPVSKHLMSDISPLLIAFLRYFTAVITLTPIFIFEIRKNSNKFNLKTLFIFFIAGLAGTAVFAVFLFNGVKLSNASNGSIITNTQPVFTAILAPLLIREGLSRIQIAGIIMGFLGMLLVVSGGNLGFLTSGSDMITGNLLLIGGAVSMSLYGIIIKSSVKKYGGLLPTWFSMLFGTIVLFIITLFSVDNIPAELSTAGGSDIALVIYMGSIATALAYLLFTASLKYIDVVKATAFKFLIPVSGVGLSIFFIGERPAIATYAGIIIVIFSVFLIQGGINRSARAGKAKMKQFQEGK